MAKDLFDELEPESEQAESRIVIQPGAQPCQLVSVLHSASILSDLALRTWNRIGTALRHDVPYGETTITDTNTLDLRIVDPANVRIAPVKDARTEARTGFDWEWWIGSRSSGWSRFAVQAKKLSMSSGTYAFGQTVPTGDKGNRALQLDVLASFAESQSCIPIYCLYNNTQSRPSGSCWHCLRNYEHQQLGCTLAPLHVVRECQQTRGARTFERVHEHDHVCPWRCVLCPNKITGGDNESHLLSPKGSGPSFGFYDTLPDHIVEMSSNDSSAPIDLPSALYASQLGGRPRRICVVNIEG